MRTNSPQYKNSNMADTPSNPGPQSNKTAVFTWPYKLKFSITSLQMKRNPCMILLHSYNYSTLSAIIYYILLLVKI